MLTSFCWVPRGAMKQVPILSTDSLDQVKLKIKAQSPGFVEEEVEGNIQGGKGENEDNSGDDDTLRAIAGGGNGAILEQVESDDGEELDDIQYKETDLIFVAASADPDVPRLEVYVYDEPEDNMYVHHDAEISAFPLSTAWLTDGNMSMCAISTMHPFIEVWALDVMDSVAPAFILGGCEKLEHNYKKKTLEKNLKPESHRDAVLSVRWNTVAQHILASGSADHTIKLWDLTQNACLGTYNEPEKVQTLDWHMSEANLLLSGGFDATMILRDCRNPDQAAMRFPLGSVIEHVEFYPHDGGRMLLASTSTGEWKAYETRMNSAPLWSLKTHDGETTFSCSRHVQGLVATGGAEGKITLWNCHDFSQPPKPIVTRDYNTGAVLSLGFHPNSPHILGAGGAKGEPLVYTITNDIKDSFLQKHQI